MRRILALLVLALLSVPLLAQERINLFPGQILAITEDREMDTPRHHFPGGAK